MTKEEKNSQAYQDCANYDEPSRQNDEEYMDFYRYWRTIARYPEDEPMHDEDYN